MIRDKVEAMSAVDTSLFGGVSVEKSKKKQVPEGDVLGGGSIADFYERKVTSSEAYEQMRAEERRSKSQNASRKRQGNS